MNSNNEHTVLTRRNIIKVGAFSVMGTMLPSVSLSQSNTERLYNFLGDIPLDKLNFALFSQLEGDDFKLQVTPDELYTAKLVEVTQAHSDDGKQERFSLLFEAKTEVVLDQKIYDFEHPTIGQCSIFIVPVGQRDHTIQYEAVFNRLLV